ncbi:MAG: NAD-dependent epimerase/dehydratase family protein [Betaproteobacteria bacterium]|nr:NAD-dependent epimerase/dehydratase family protein [Betaproteobacteria bacterium]
MNIVVTGSSSCLARALLPRLCADPEVTQVTGIDLLPEHFAHAKFRSLIADFRDPQVMALLPDHNALVHLAYVVLRGHMPASAMHDVNVSGSLKLLQAAQAAGVRRIIHLSSAAVYGGGTNLAETAPYAPLPDFCYGAHKAELEQLLEQTVPQCVRLRPHVILGPNAQPTLRQMLALPAYPALADPQPELQCVHENDVADAIIGSLKRDVQGAYNLAAAESFTLRDVMRHRHALCLPLPAVMARAGLAIAHRMSGWGGETGWLSGLGQTLTLDCSRAARELHWQPAYAPAQTLAATGITAG